MAWRAPEDPIANGIRLVVAIGGFAAKPGLISGLKTGLSIQDTLTKMLSEAPPGVKQMAAVLSKEAAVIFEGFRDLPSDAPVLYEQMVTQSLPDPREIVLAEMNAGQITEAMLAKLSDPEHLRPPMPGLFKALSEPTLEKLLAAPQFADDLSPAFMEGVLSGLGDLKVGTVALRDGQARTETKIDNIGAALDSVASANRDLLEALAARFRIPDAFDLPDAVLREELEKRAEDYRRVLKDLAALKGVSDRIDNIHAAAMDAVRNLRLDEARQLLRDARSIVREERLRPVLEENAKLMVAEAEIELLDQNPDAAYDLLSSAADNFASIDPLEPARKRLGYADLLIQHGRQYAGQALELAVEITKTALASVSLDDDCKLWSALHGTIGNALVSLGERRGDPVALGKAILAYRSALEVYTKERMPLQWARTQINLGSALSVIGELKGETEPLDEAVPAFRASLKVLTRDNAPLEWAQTQMNLGNALLILGVRQGDENTLLQAVFSYRSVFKVCRKNDNPTLWARTQMSLGSALVALSAWQSDSTGLQQAVKAHRAALQVLTRDNAPSDWAKTQNNLGNALLILGVRQGDSSTLQQAVDAFSASLEIDDRVHSPHGFAQTNGNLALAYLSLATCKGRPDPAAELEEALEAVDAALEVFSAADTPYDHDTATRLRERILAARAALDP